MSEYSNVEDIRKKIHEIGSENLDHVTYLKELTSFLRGLFDDINSMSPTNLEALAEYLSKLEVSLDQLYGSSDSPGIRSQLRLVKSVIEQLKATIARRLDLSPEELEKLLTDKEVKEIEPGSILGPIAERPVPKD